VRLTSPGRAAVASLLVAGPAATAKVERHFHPASGRALADHRFGQIVFGRWSAGEHGEEVVVCRRDGGRVEIHCHGGRAATRAIVAALVEDGCREVEWQAWVRHSTGEPIAADAQIALAGALTERTAMILLDQHAGALTTAIREIGELLAAGDGASAVERIDRLLEWRALGAHLSEPWKVVLTGRPNVGKSSLINALVGYQRAIVHPTPGTTRDVVTVTTAVAGWPIELADTAGLHGAAEPLEAAGIERARDTLRSADLVVVVTELSQPLSSEEERLPLEWPGCLRVFNKCDLVSGSLDCCGIATSAVRGDGLDELKRMIAARLVPRVPHAGEAIPFLPWHAETLAAARAAIAEGRPSEAESLMRRFASC
jgi:tRNA modification GTPase